MKVRRIREQTMAMWSVRAIDGTLSEQTITVNVQNSNDAPDDLFGVIFRWLKTSQLVH